MNDDTDLLQHTALVICAFVSNNVVAAADLPTLIAQVHGTLGRLGAPEVEAAAPSLKATPAQIRKSITPDALISFEDGRPYKALKRHLSTHGLTPADYRAKWGLPDSYPMTAATYSAARSAMAKSIGLGNKAAGKKQGARKTK